MVPDKPTCVDSFSAYLPLGPFAVWEIRHNRLPQVSSEQWTRRWLELVQSPSLPGRLRRLNKYYP